jgi:hypothetical protein
LFAHNVQTDTILEFADEIQRAIETLNPALVYLTQRRVPRALERNFRRRGERFRDFVIRYVIGTPYARLLGLTGYDGMVIFWQEFVELTDNLYERWSFAKTCIENSACDWERYNRQVLEFLGLPRFVEPDVTADVAEKLVGEYRDAQTGRVIVVEYDNTDLLINFIHTTRTRLIPQDNGLFLTEGWYFEIEFDYNDRGDVMRLAFRGRDVDYLALVGVVAEKQDDAG